MLASFDPHSAEKINNMVNRRFMNMIHRREVDDGNGVDVRGVRRSK
jgi:hypothetical protein